MQENMTMACWPHLQETAIVPCKLPAAVKAGSLIDGAAPVTAPVV
jgi:hypothetical protein